MKAFVYVLRSRSGRFYYGSTNDLERRLEQHRRGHTATTAKDTPWELIASKEMDSVEAARHQERVFKRWKKPERILEWFQQMGATGDLQEWSSPDI